MHLEMAHVPIKKLVQRYNPTPFDEHSKLSFDLNND